MSSLPNGLLPAVSSTLQIDVFTANLLQATGLSTAFNSTTLVATIFLPKNEAFANLLSLVGMTVDQALSNQSSFAPYLGQVGDLCLRGNPGSPCPHARDAHACKADAGTQDLLCLQILEYHVIPDVVLHASNFSNGQVFKTVINDTIRVRSATQSSAPCPFSHSIRYPRCHGLRLHGKLPCSI